jgi:hypothetical protein
MLEFLCEPRLRRKGEQALGERDVFLRKVLRSF